MIVTVRYWTPQEDDQLRACVEANRNIGAIARELHRTEGSVIARGYKLGLRFGRPKTLGLGVRKNEKARPK